MKAKDVRAAFLDFFEDRFHDLLRSSPLVTSFYTTLLFTNSVMVKFKDVFSGT